MYNIRVCALYNKKTKLYNNARQKDNSNRVVPVFGHGQNLKTINNYKKNTIIVSIGCTTDEVIIMLMASHRTVCTSVTIMCM